MYRRAVLAAVAGGVSLSGCISRRSDTPAEADVSPVKDTDTTSPVRRTGDGVEASFRVVDGHAPTDDAVDATFEDERVIVTGTIDPEGCDRPVLDSVTYDAPAGIARVVVGGESPYGATATVECGNASFDYRCVVTTDEGRPGAVEVVHRYESSDDLTFALER